MGWGKKLKTQPSEYLNKLPESFSPEDKVLVTDPMLATGGTLMHALNLIVERGAKPQNIRVICAVACPPGLSKISERLPDKGNTVEKA